MDTSTNMILKHGEDITADVIHCEYNQDTKKYDITYKNGNTYPHNDTTIIWMRDPEVWDPAQVRISRDGRAFYDIKIIWMFQASSGPRYLRIRFKTGHEKSYCEQELEIVHSCLRDPVAGSRLDYLKQLAAVNELRTEEGTALLAKQYERLEFVGEDTALAVYLTPDRITARRHDLISPIFPFGCNASQYAAVQAALTNQMSIVQGPPGTGKTQTILNVIANLLIVGKSALVVSNNNSATENVLEKLSSERYGMGFLVAPLGSNANKERFVENQTGLYPDLSGWAMDEKSESHLTDTISALSKELSEIFKKQERLALARQELNTLDLETHYFEQYCQETMLEKDHVKMRRTLKAERIMQLWLECLDFSERQRPLSFWYKVKSVLLYGISDWDFFRKDSSSVISLLQSLYYQTRRTELCTEIASLEQTLQVVDASAKQEKLTELSMMYLRGCLYRRYGNQQERVRFNENSFWTTPQTVAKEYPVILSTTFSSKSCLGREMVFDYVIMDESSQVDIATGALALSCARNAVIVGDVKQLANVVTEETKEKTNTIWEAAGVPAGYSFFDNSFLKSVCGVLPDAPQTLLREHYRCHPKIIGFCNQKFYNNELIIMTEDKGEKDVLLAYRTVPGNHRRGRMNQRQIDVIQSEALPRIGTENLGVITPYNEQVDAVQAQIASGPVDVATVHKFQGREKDAIIFSTVDDVVTNFSDDPHLLNVSISRARKKLCLVTSNNKQPSGSNVGDLLAYIEYHNFAVIDSETYSVFDYLYQQYTRERIAFLHKHKRVSQYDSENLMYGMIEDVLCQFTRQAIGVVSHHPLNMLIRDPRLLNDQECRYVMNPGTHLDFLIYSRISRKPVLAIEVDGFRYHHNNPLQEERDRMKDRILTLYGIPLLRFPTNGSGEKAKLVNKLSSILKVHLDDDLGEDE